MAKLKTYRDYPPEAPKYTEGLAVPRGNKMATYNPRLNTYNKEFNNKGYLIAQGIGNVTGTPEDYTRAFSKAFSSAFS